VPPSQEHSLLSSLGLAEAAFPRVQIVAEPWKLIRWNCSDM